MILQSRKLILFLAALIASSTATAQTTLVVLVRHGEKAAQPASDPPLTAEGEARAKALSDALANAGISAIISTPFERTLGTVRPLGTKLGIKVDTVPIGAGVPTHAQAVVAAVHKHHGKAVLVVGHSNTIMQIAAALGAPSLPDLCDGDYDQIITLELQASGPPRMTRTRYGASAADPKCGKMN
jgi:broad specificity phosphatase PhoE